MDYDGARKRVLTQKYNMAVLKKLSELDQRLVAWLGKVYNCDEEDVQIEIDLHEIYNGGKAQWESSMVRIGNNPRVVTVVEGGKHSSFLPGHEASE